MTQSEDQPTSVNKPPCVPVETAAIENSSESTNESILTRSWGWAKTHRLGLAFGAMALSAGATIATGAGEKAVDVAKDELPAVAGGMVAMETMWIGGAAMMASSVGAKVKNPMKVKSQFGEVAEHANSSKLFQAGFWINTAGAVGEFVIPAVAVCTKLPPETWGVLTPSLVDLGVTISIRSAIRSGLQSAGALPTIEKSTD